MGQSPAAGERNGALDVLLAPRPPSVAEARRRAAGQARIMIVEVSMRTAIDASRSADPMRFTNHSCAPNARLQIRGGRIEFYSLRPIARGDEDTVARQRDAVAERTPDLLPLFDALVATTRGLVPA